jgi:predicted dehydrogenase
MWGKPAPGVKKDVDDYALALIHFEGGATLQLNVSWALHIEFMQPDAGVRLMGDKGGVQLRGLDEPWVYSEEAGHITDTKPYFQKNEMFLDEMKHFVQCVEEGKQPMASAEQGRTVQSILDAIYRSGEEQREVRLDR